MSGQFKSFQTHGLKGVTDLISYSPYTDGEWSIFSPAFPITEEEYLADIESYQRRVIEKNEQYVARLKEKDEYGKDSTTTFNFMTLPEFDDSEAKDSRLGDFTIAMPLGNLENSEKVIFPEIKYWPDDDPRKYREAAEIHARLTLEQNK